MGLLQTLAKCAGEGFLTKSSQENVLEGLKKTWFTLSWRVLKGVTALFKERHVSSSLVHACWCDLACINQFGVLCPQPFACDLALRSMRIIWELGFVAKKCLSRERKIGKEWGREITIQKNMASFRCLCGGETTFLDFFVSLTLEI